MKITIEEIKLANGFNQFNLVDENNLIIGVIAGFAPHTNKQNAELLSSAPELLIACENALRDIHKLNTQLIEEGKHGYVLMENELNNVINKAYGSSVR